MKEAFALISAILVLAAAPPYIIDTVRGKTKPQRVTWLILSVLGLIAFVSQVGLGATWSLVFSGLDATVCGLVFGLAIKYGVGGYERLDIAALALAGVGVVVAVACKAPLISLAGVIVADISATALTVRKAFLDPGSETTTSWLLAGTAAVFGVLAVGRLSAPLLLYPLYLVLANYAVPLAQVMGRAWRRR